jgi:hypothetical protein
MPDRGRRARRCQAGESFGDLKTLSPIKEHGGGLRLTPRERYLALPKRAVHHSETDEFISKLLTS